MTIKSRLFISLSVLCLISLASPSSQVVAQTNIFLDYSNFQTRLNELANTAGVTDFTVAETNQISAGITTNMEATFSLFDGFNFVDSDPGGIRAEVPFGLITGDGGLGVADHIDFLNRSKDDVARVFTAEFAFIIDEFTGSTNRQTQINQLTAALSGTAAHELGHNLGLRHHDSHGDLTYTGTLINTGNNEDTHVMATGSTGLGEVGRQTIRDFSVHSLVKLAYADGSLLSGNPVEIAELGDAGDTLASAQLVNLEEIAVANRFGEVIIGSLNSNTDGDLFRVQLDAGSQFTADINNDYESGFGADPVDTFLEFFDSNGNLLFSSDDTNYSATQFGPSTDQRSQDAIFYNIDITTSGNYYVRVSSFDSASSGDYQLLLHTNFYSVPEPSAIAILTLGLGAVSLRRRRRRI